MSQLDHGRSVLNQVDDDQRRREEEEAEDEVAEKAVPLASGDPGRPEGDRQPD